MSDEPTDEQMNTAFLSLEEQEFWEKRKLDREAEDAAVVVALKGIEKQIGVLDSTLRFIAAVLTILVLGLFVKGC